MLNMNAYQSTSRFRGYHERTSRHSGTGPTTSTQTSLSFDSTSRIKTCCHSLHLSPAFLTNSRSPLLPRLPPPFFSIFSTTTLPFLSRSTIKQPRSRQQPSSNASGSQSTTSSFLSATSPPSPPPPPSSSLLDLNTEKDIGTGHPLNLRDLA